MACPKEKTLRQREKFFGGMGFLDLEGLLLRAEGEGGEGGLRERGG